MGQNCERTPLFALVSLVVVRLVTQTGVDRVGSHTQTFNLFTSHCSHAMGDSQRGRERKHFTLSDEVVSYIQQQDNMSATVEAAVREQKQNRHQREQVSQLLAEIAHLIKTRDDESRFGDGVAHPDRMGKLLRDFSDLTLPEWGRTHPLAVEVKDINDNVNLESLAPDADGVDWEPGCADVDEDLAKKVIVKAQDSLSFNDAVRYALIDRYVMSEAEITTDRDPLEDTVPYCTREDSNQ